MNDFIILLTESTFYLFYFVLLFVIFIKGLFNELVTITVIAESRLKHCWYQYRFWNNLIVFKLICCIWCLSETRSLCNGMEMNLVCFPHAIFILVIPVAHHVIAALLRVWGEVLVHALPQMVLLVQAVSEIKVILCITNILLLLWSNGHRWMLYLYFIFIFCEIGSLSLDGLLLLGSGIGFVFFEVFWRKGMLGFIHLDRLLLLRFWLYRWTALSGMLCRYIFLVVRFNGYLMVGVLFVAFNSPHYSLFLNALLLFWPSIGLPTLEVALRSTWLRLQWLVILLELGRVIVFNGCIWVLAIKHGVFLILRY